MSINSLRFGMRNDINKHNTAMQAARPAMLEARDAALAPPPPVINNRRQAPAPTAPGGAWGGMLAPNPSAPPVPGLPDPAQMQQTSDQQAGLQKKGSIWDRMVRGQGSLSGGMQPTGGV